MLLNLLMGLPVIMLCLLLQAAFVALSLRQYVRVRNAHRKPDSLLWNTALLSLVLLLMLLGNFVQMGIWAALFMMLDEFDTFATALYFSGVTFATLGYGDIVMSERWRLLSPLEAANGILMFGVSTAVMTAAVMDVIKRHTPRSQQRPDD
ncbi:two pore domain potassium channel family protein [Pseudomonas cavernae]|uniref:Two pore domain potassium channel family protein n=1 Tax=Pseudomonas cavernae TaxID=2320867 RepID=A0A385Z1L2_9PSED|nr:potassium channel family protein [Pseudomonas cavernae]AYC32966.1 two pore domain potassium channel family protein [Pseudomonas cavernae]